MKLLSMHFANVDETFDHIGNQAGWNIFKHSIKDNLGRLGYTILTDSANKSFSSQLIY